jgi:hypothetical protein
VMRLGEFGVLSVGQFAPVSVGLQAGHITCSSRALTFRCRRRSRPSLWTGPLATWNCYFALGAQAQERTSEVEQGRLCPTY